MAKVYLPACGTVTEGGKPVEAAKDGGNPVVQVGSGTWMFAVK